MRGGKWTPSPNTTKGVADIIAILNSDNPMLGSIFVAIEVKRPGGKVSADQAAFLAGVNQAGGIGIVAYSVKDVMEVFE